MKLLDRIRELRNDSWYSPFYTLQRRLRKYRNRNELIPFEDLVDGLYRAFTGRLDRASKWSNGVVTMPLLLNETLDPNYKEPDVVIPLVKTKSSSNHIGLFSILFSPLEFAETALRGNMARSEKTRERLAVSTIVLWGAINLTRAAFGLVGVALSLIPAGIYYFFENRRIEKQKNAQDYAELSMLREHLVIDEIQKLNKPENACKIENNNSYWVIKTCQGKVSHEVKSKPVNKDGNYDAIYANKPEFENFDDRFVATVGSKFGAKLEPQAGESRRAKASLFKATLEKQAPSENKKTKKPNSQKYIYIPLARPSYAN